MLYKLSNELLELSKTKTGGYTKEQLNIIGVSWPPPKGWKKKITNTMLPYDIIDAFVRHNNNNFLLQGKNKKRLQNK